MGKTSTTLNIYITGLFLVSIAALTLVLTHDNKTCNYRPSGASDWKPCDESFNAKCVDPASSIDLIESPAGLNIEAQIVCPWRKRTGISSYISISLSLVFVVLVISTPKFKSFGLNTAIGSIGFICIGALLFTFCSMLVDIRDGHNTQFDFNAGENEKVTVTQTVFIIDAVLISLAFILVTIFTIYAFKTRGQFRKNVAEEEAEVYAHDHYIRFINS